MAGRQAVNIDCNENESKTHILCNESLYIDSYIS
jgi:hypothetical protein